MAQDRDLVVVFESTEATELGLAMSVLQSAEVPFVESGGSASALLATTLGAQFGGLKRLLVRAEDEERAIEALEAAWGPRDDDPAVE